MKEVSVKVHVEIGTGMHIGNQYKWGDDHTRPPPPPPPPPPPLPTKRSQTQVANSNQLTLSLPMNVFC